jgi:hypothetical protein
VSETVPDLVAAYRHGEMTLDDLATKIAGKTWPPGPPRSTDPVQVWKDAEDVSVTDPGTWNGDVRHLVATGALTDEEYYTILEATLAAKAPDR